MIEQLFQLSGRRVLVTGASGFIGGHLCRRLVSLGSELHAISRVVQSHDEHCRWWQADLTDFACVRDILSTVEPDLIYHLASHVAGSRDVSMVLPTLNANLVSTVNLMTAAAEVGCRRIVLAGSMEEPNDHLAVPSSPYAAAKWSARVYARMFHELYEIQTINLRIAMVYGPAQPDESKFIPYVIQSLLNGDVPRLSSGQREVDWIYVADVVDAMIASAKTNDKGFLSIEIGSGVSTSIRDVAERLCQMINPSIRPLLGAVADRPCDRSWSANLSLAQEKLSWQPRTKLDDGLRQTVDWYRSREQNSATSRVVASF
jgi:UDP-glucose 4-epimerase